jgi:hypothetical protein
MKSVQQHLSPATETANKPTSEVTKVAVPPELIARRGEHIRALARTQAPVFNRYLRALEPLKQKLAREGKVEPALAVEAEIKTVRQQLSLATETANKPASEVTKVAIISASFGDPLTNRMVDVTKQVKKMLAAKVQPAPWADFPPDPAFGVHKSVVITYTINGELKTKTYPVSQAVNLPQELQ